MEELLRQLAGKMFLGLLDDPAFLRQVVAAPYEDTRKVLSDEFCKSIAGKDELSPIEVEALAKLAGKSPEGYSLDDSAGWDDKTFEAYGNHLRNYLYTYKDEAKNVDPNIDPSQPHIGTMAQDIEKINPSCIQETPEGVKTVDTGRLALMNAGAIGAASRHVKSLEERMSDLEEAVYGTRQ